MKRIQWSVSLAGIGLAFGLMISVSPGLALAAHHGGNNWGNGNYNNGNTVQVPEPSTLLLLGSGLAGFAIARSAWKRFKG